MTRRITGIISRIRSHTTDPVPTPPGHTQVTMLAIDDLLDRLAQLVAIDDNSPSSIDGFPSKTPGARPPEAVGYIDAVPDPDDQGPDTIVERSALQLATQGNPRDQVHQIRKQAEEAAATIGHNLVMLAGALARFDKIRQPLPLDTPQCWVARTIHQLPIDTKWIPGDDGKKTRFDGVITVPWRVERPVCRWTYDFTRRWRRLPTRDEMLEYLRTGYVRVNETIEQKAGKPA